MESLIKKEKDYTQRWAPPSLPPSLPRFLPPFLQGLKYLFFSPLFDSPFLPPSFPPSLPPSSSEGCNWHPEFGSWMVESTPSRPYTG
jgi:hypothetical protein